MTTDTLPAAGMADAINAEHDAAQAAARTAIEHAIECGRLLLDAKEQCGHGAWLPWLETHTRVSVRQAQRYMRVARAAIEGKYDGASHLSIEGALSALAPPKPEAAEPKSSDALSPDRLAFFAEQSRREQAHAMLLMRLIGQHGADGGGIVQGDDGGLSVMLYRGDGSEAGETMEIHIPAAA